MLIREEYRLMKAIAHRASHLYERAGVKINPEFIESELRTVHYEICNLRLNDLLHAEIDDFSHDIGGIHEHLDLLDGSFKNGFVPRFARW